MAKRSKMNTLLIVIVLIGIVVSGCSKAMVEEEVVEENYIPVETSKASISNISNKLNIKGKTFASEEISIMPKVPGIVTKVNVELGDIVEEGSVLFIIEQDDLLKSGEQVYTSVEVARKNVEQAENALKVASLNYELNKEKIENAQLNLQRTKELYEDGAVSKSQLEQAELAASDKSLETVERQVVQAEIAYEQAKNQLKQAEISYEQAQSNISNTVVIAPITGVISTLNVKEGQLISNAQLAAAIVDMDTVYIQINVVENIVNRLNIGQEVVVKVPAALDDEVKSTISYISPTADLKSQLYPVKVYINNPHKKIRPGMNGEVELSTDQTGETIAVKGNAVLEKEGKTVVYVVENDIAVEKIVTTGLDTGEYIEIKEGIKEGENVIVKGQHYVEDGLKVKVVRGE